MKKLTVICLLACLLFAGCDEAQDDPPNNNDSGLGAYDDLWDVIQEAEQMFKDVPAMGNGLTLQPGDRYMWSQTDWNVLQAAIHVATNVYTDGIATEEEVEAAIIVLENAMTEFWNKSQVHGEGINKVDLQEAINAANSLIGNVTRTNDGTDAQGDPLSSGAQWARETDWDAFRNAINNAIDVNINSNEQSEIEEMLGTLNSAREVFEGQIETVS